MHKAPNQIPRDVLQEWYCVISTLRGPDCDLCWERTRFHWSLSLTDSVTSPVALLTCPAETTYGGQKTLAHSFRGFSHSRLGRQSGAPRHGSVAWCRRKHHRLEPEAATEDSTVSWGPSFQNNTLQPTYFQFKPSQMPSTKPSTEGVVNKSQPQNGYRQMETRGAGRGEMVRVGPEQLGKS